MREAFFLNQPALAVAGGTPGEAFCLAACEAPNVVVETIKQAEDGDGIIVRMYESENALTDTVLHWGRPVAEAVSCDCLEQPDGEPVTVDAEGIHFTIKPYEIKTLRIR